jgi:CheY-like chemotaxis protein
VDRATFVRLVRDALTLLDDDLALSDHDLAREMGGGAPLPSEALRSLLLEAVDAGRSAARTNDVAARQHRQLVMRFLERRRRDDVAAELGVSVRQANRDLDAAVEAVASVLWRRRPPDGAGGELAQELTALARHDEGASHLATAVEGVVATMQNLAAASGTTFEVAILDTLPGIALGRTLLRQAVLNLCMYALAVAPGRRLAVTATDTAAGVVLRIGAAGDAAGAATPGAGVPELDAEALFATALRLLESQGGRVARGDDASPSLVRVVLPPVSLRTILVVDDNPDVARLFQRYLGGEPYRLIQATSGEGVEPLAAELRPEAIVLDVMLPLRDGWEILQELRASPRTRDIPVIVCSILPERALALSLGVSDFLTKPVTPSALREALARWCPPPAFQPALT